MRTALNCANVTNALILKWKHFDEIIEYIKEEPTNDELIKQSLLTEKSELESWLREHDYIGVKIATGRATISDYLEEIALMNEKANRINEIDKILNEHT